LPEFNTFYGVGRTYTNETQVEAQWQHVVLTFDVSEDRLRWYINGVNTNTDPAQQLAGNGQYPNFDGPLLLGTTRTYSGRQYLDGFLDEFAVYDKRLDDPDGDGDESDSRILAHFNELDLYTNIAGDFGGDGNVNGSDFLRWQLGESPGRGLDGSLSADDLADWEATFGQAAPLLAGVGVVPEPSSLLLACSMAMAVATRRRRCC